MKSVCGKCKSNPCECEQIAAVEKLLPMTPPTTPQVQELIKELRHSPRDLNHRAATALESLQFQLFAKEQAYSLLEKERTALSLKCEVIREALSGLMDCYNSDRQSGSFGDEQPLWDKAHAALSDPLPSEWVRRSVADGLATALRMADSVLSNPHNKFDQQGVTYAFLDYQKAKDTALTYQSESKK